jgi:hypothetical protein
MIENIKTKYNELMNVDIDRKTFLKKAGIFLLAIPFLSPSVMAKSWFRDEAGNLYPIDGMSNYITSSALTPYAKLDGTNQPFQPTVDTTTRYQFNDKDGNVIVNVDTVNNRLGVNTSAPLYALDIGGAIRAVRGGYLYDMNLGDTTNGGKFLFTGKTGTSYSYIFDNTLGNYLSVKSNKTGAGDFVIDADGKVGIGTTAPVSQLEVFKSDSTATLGNANGAITLRNPETVNAVGSRGYTGIDFAGGNTTDTGTYGGIYGVVTGSGASGQIGSILFGTKSSITDTSLTERMRITSDGNVGIGTTAPTAPLHVGPTHNSVSFSQVTSKFIENYNGVAGIDMANLSTGTSAEYRFIIADTSDHIFTMTQPGAGNTNTLFGVTRSTADYIFNNGGTDRDMIIGTIGAKTVSLGTFNLKRLTVGATGLVGINTTAPLSTNGGLDISSGGNSLIIGADSAATTRTDATDKYGRYGLVHYTNAEEPSALLWGYNTSSNNNIYIGGGTSGFNASTRIRFYTAANNTTTTGTERMTIDPSGYVGIGTTAPSAKAHIVGNTDIVQLKVVANATQTSNIMDVFASDGTTAKFHILGDGKVGINTTTPLSTNGGLDIASGGLGLVIGADSAASTRTNSTIKYSRIVMPHYTNTEETQAMIFGQSQSAYNILGLGGGMSSNNAATHINFFAAANTTTLNGTNVGQFTINGLQTAGASVGVFGGSLQNMSSNLYVQSRLENLTTNGSGLMGNNYNFSTLTFDQVETHGGGGSFRINAAQTSRFSDEYIPVDITKNYKQNIWVKCGDTGGGNFNAANKQYIGLASYDIDLNPVQPENVNKYATAVDTTLAAPLNPGDTTITLTNATGWYNSSSWTTRGILFYGYTNSKGYTYPNYTYSRNYSGLATFSGQADFGANGTWAAPNALSLSSVTWSSVDNSLTTTSTTILTHGFVVGDTLTSTNVANPGPFTIATVTASKITFNEVVVNSTASTTITNVGAGITGNVIKLRRPWAGIAIASGTAVRNSYYSGTYKYNVISSVTVPNAWTQYTGYIGPASGYGSDDANEFRAGTAFIKWLFLINYHLAADNNVRYSDLTLNEVNNVNNVILRNATADEIAYQFDYQTNKSAGLSTGIRLKMIDTSTPSGAKLMNLGTGSAVFVSKWNVDTIGTVWQNGSIVMGSSLAGARTISLDSTATDVGGKNLDIYAGSTVAGTAVNDVAGGSLNINSGAGTGIGASVINFKTGTTLTSGKTLQTMGTKMTILGNGNVGIGTTNPVQTLAVQAPTTSTVGMMFSGGVNGYAVGMGATSAFSFIQGYSNLTGSLARDLQLQPSGGNLLISGNVGIGTTSPGAKLDVQSSLTDGTVDNYGMKSTLTMTPSADTAKWNIGTLSQVYLAGSNNLTGGWGSGGVIGSQMVIRNNGTGVVSNAYAMVPTVQNTGTGITTNAYALFIPDGYTPSGSITNYKSLYINTPTVGTATNYPLYIVGGNSYFGGNVGIGTTAPTAKLHITGSTDAVQFKILGNSTQTSNIVDVFDSNGTTPRFHIAGDGNVGIGTNAPVASLHIVSPTIASQLRLTTNLTNNNTKYGGLTVSHYNNSEEPLIAFYGESNATENVVVFGGGSSSSNSATKVSFFTAANTTTLQGTERMTIKSDGLVGIGNTSPNSLLDVSGGADGVTSVLATFRSKFGLNTGTTIRLANSSVITSNAGVELTSLRTDASANTDFIISSYTNTGTPTVTEKMRIKGISGNVGIGTTAPSGTLHVNGSYFGKITTVTDTYNILTNDSTIVCNKTTAFTVTLPTAVVGQIFNIKNIGVGVVTVDGAGSDTIDGETTQTLSQWDCLKIQCSSANTWIII